MRPVSRADTWNFTIRLPLSIKKQIQRYMLDNDIDEFQDVGEEMLIEWAQKRKIKLAAGREPKSKESDSQVVLAS